MPQTRITLIQEGAWPMTLIHIQETLEVFHLEVTFPQTTL